MGNTIELDPCVNYICIMNHIHCVGPLLISCYM
uniref:Uncharacterized protein n=1 Tax=Rhizophora mucronata TaxID=61149 RepID=A0A2P2PCV3_RHIMU